MGRYYYGDIEGKFWFAVQSSDAADRFGVIGEEPHYIEYDFTEDNLEEVEEELEAIKRNLGENLDKLENFFKDSSGGDDEKLAIILNCEPEEVKGIISEYADYELGMEIRDAIKKDGHCYFTAEL